MANNVPEVPVLPKPPRDPFLQSLTRILLATLSAISFRLNRSLQKDGTEAMTAPLVLATFTTSTLPTVGDWTGAVIFVSNGGAGTKFRGSDGSSWLSLG